MTADPTKIAAVDPSTVARQVSRAPRPRRSARAIRPARAAPLPNPRPWDTDDSDDDEDRWQAALNPAQAARVRAMFDRLNGHRFPQ